MQSKLLIWSSFIINFITLKVSNYGKEFWIFFYLKKRNKNANGEIEIFVKITVNSASTLLSTKRKCFKANWNVKAGRAEGRTDYAKSINSYLDTIQQKVFEAKRKLIELDIEVTPHAIKDLMLGKNINKQKHMLNLQNPFLSMI